MEEVTDLSLNIFGRSMNSIPLLMRGFDKVSYMSYFRIYKWLESMLSIISSHESCII